MPTGVQRLSPSHSTVCRVDSSARIFLSLPSVHSRSCRAHRCYREIGATAPSAPQAAPHTSHHTEQGSDCETLSLDMDVTAPPRQGSHHSLGPATHHTGPDGPAELQGKAILWMGHPDPLAVPYLRPAQTADGPHHPCAVWCSIWSGLQRSKALNHPKTCPKTQVKCQRKLLLSLQAC